MHIVLLHLSEDPWKDISFPELEEITENLMFFQAWGLKSLGQLFPNLAVIRGDYLVQDYALVVNHMPDLTEIGLTNLIYIAQGSVKIDVCPKLCHAGDINWSKILEADYVLKDDHNREVTCKPCPDKCDGHCWNDNMCYRAHNNNCHPECIGCKGPLPTDCISCRYAREESGRCVEKCPEDNILNIETRECISVQACKSILNGTYLHFDGRCMKACPPKYEPTIKTGTMPHDSEPCQYCGDRCEKQCVGKVVDTQSSVRDFHKCTFVNGSMIFKITNRKVAALLYENMRMIREINGTLTIRRSNLLTSLDFLHDLQRIGSENNVSLSVMDNENLAELWDLTNRSIVIPNGSRVYFHYNPKLCYSKIRKLTDHLHIEPTDLEVPSHSNGETVSCDNFTLNTRIVDIWPTNVTLVWDDIPNSMYLFYYIEDVAESIYSCYDACDWHMFSTYTNNITLKRLTPHLKYSYFIKLFHDGLTVPRQTVIFEFHTLSADPSPPENVLAISNRYDNIVVSWESPLILNGILSHYVLIRHLEPDVEEYLYQRDYCKSQFSIKTTVVPQHLVNDPAKATAALQSEDSCKCKKSRSIEFDFKMKGTFSEFCDYLQGSEDQEELSVGCRPYRYITGDTHHYNKRFSYGRPHTEETTIAANATSFEIQNLDPYSMYVFFISACNVNRTMEPQCSEVVMVYNRTRRKDDGDRIIDGIHVKVDSSDATLSWSEPPLSNSILLTYEIEFKDKLPVTCLSRHQSQLLNFVYRFRKLIPGEYHVRMRATSLAGPGEYTPYVLFEIEEKRVDSIELYLLFLIILPFVVIIGGLTVWWWYKRRLRFNHPLIKIMNPEYHDCQYELDQWEMERDDIEIMEVLGEGTFGHVNTGFVKSTKKYCAVKSVNPDASSQDKQEFLHEASVMKSFDTHHVVKLIGVVTRSLNVSSPLVIMELMTRGDLKTFLRQSRDSSTSITCAELYRMAIQIADGMAYLSAKKYIHRDLAARNCMVSADHTVKIGDFGMARDIYFNDYYRKETKGLLPVRWMAPESLKDGVFTSDSDAWSYGVVLWEMMTLAEQPYQGLANEQVFQYVTAHGTLQRPSGCPDIIWDIMNGCWNWRPTARPLFTDIVVSLEPNVGPDFRAVSFYFSREGEEYRMTNRERPANAAALSRQYQHLNGNGTVHWSTDDQITMYNEAGGAVDDVDDDVDPDVDHRVLLGNGGGLLIERGEQEGGYLGMVGRRKTVVEKH